MMKKLVYLASAVFAVAFLGLTSCSAPNPKVNARAVPERMDDFIFENDYYCFRIYGKALEGRPTAPGVDFWAKNCDTWVAEGRYELYKKGGDASYHKDYGNGRDCYKVGVSLGAGASSPFISDTLRFPATNYRSYEILSSSPKKAVFVLHYPEWEVCGYTIALDKKLTVEAGKRFCEVEDCYTFSGPGETLDIAAGIFRHQEEDVLEDLTEPDRIAIWERASDLSGGPEDGLIGVAVVMQDAAESKVAAGHSLLIKPVKSGEKLNYYISAVWSKYDVPSAQDWFKIVKDFQPACSR